MKKKISRKKFIRTAALGAAGSALLASSCVENTSGDLGSINVNSNKKYKWKMLTTWPPNFPVLGEGANKYAELVNTLSAGRIEIKVYGGGELVPALEIFEAVSSGTAEIGNGAAYYWAGKATSAPFFTTVPFGMNAQQMQSWMIYGGGYELWRELYAKFNLYPVMGGNTGVQMAGWFNREINSISDFNGIKMRIPGLGGKVLEKAGGTVVLSAGAEIYTNLERGVIDATEWIGPYHDYLMGFHKIAKYYYAPGWHEPNAILETFFNKRAFDSLPLDLREILRIAAERVSTWIFLEFEAKNNFYMQKLINEEGVDVRILNDDVLAGLKMHRDEMLDELISSDPFAQKVYASYSTFAADIKKWANYSEKLYYNKI